MENTNNTQNEGADTVSAQVNRELRAGLAGEFWKDASVISVYTRTQALEEGMLIDLTEMAAEAGIVFPLAVTQELWATMNAIPASRSWESIEGRSWDVVWMLRVAIKGAAIIDVTGGKNKGVILRNNGIERYGDAKTGQTMIYPMLMSQQIGDEIEMDLRIKAVLGPGDDSRPVFTLMLPHES